MTVGELLDYIHGKQLHRDAPILLRASMPRSANPDNFEDEYGPGHQEHNVHILEGFGSLVFGDSGPVDIQVSDG